VPLAEARLSSFLAAKDGATNIDAAAEEAFLSGAIADAQGRFNIASLIDGNRINPKTAETLARLAEALDLTAPALQNLAENLRFAADRSPENLNAARAALWPQKFSDLSRFGLDAATLERLAPHATWLPVATPINVNTASAHTLVAVALGLDLSRARALVAAREREPFRNNDEFLRRAGVVVASIDTSQIAVGSRYFTVTGSLRIGDVAVIERSLVQREGLDMRVLWRERATETVASN
jgi:general secretion pathway protein K